MSATGGLTRGEKVIAFIERYCNVPDGELVGQPMVVEPFQRDFILDVYDNPHVTAKGILSIARKNGKTGLIAGILMAHIAGPEARQNSQIVSGAMARDQAAIVFDLACKMINLSPELSQLTAITPSLKRIIGLAKNVEYKALSAEAKTKHGLSPVLVILDETGQVRGSKSDFIEALTTAQGAHKEPLILVISTQAANDGDLLSIWIDDAVKHKSKKVVCHVHQAAKGCDVLDEKEWRAANPALGVFRNEEELRTAADQAKRMPSFTSSFRNLYLNQRVEMYSPFISRDIWLANDTRVDDDAFIYGNVYAGLDLSEHLDLTALAVIAWWKNTWHVRTYYWAPEEGLMDRVDRDRNPYDIWANEGFISLVDGPVVDYAAVAQDVDDILGRCQNLITVAFDRYHMKFLAKEFDSRDIKLPLVDFGQGFRSMSPAIKALETAILKHQIAHDCNPVLIMCMSNVRIVKDPTGARKMDKRKSTGRIDGAVALAMAFGVQCENQEPVGDYDGFFNASY